MHKKPNILVIGDLMVDHYLWGDCQKISPEAPVQVVDAQTEELLMGGAGNVINNLLSLGANVGVCGVIGDDEDGDFLQQRLGQKGVRKEGLKIQKGRKTTKKSRIIARHQQILRIDKEQRDDISKESEELIILRTKIILDFYDAVLLSDYGKGVLTDFVAKEIIKLAREKNKLILVDPKGDNYAKYKGATLITPNKKEAQNATNIHIHDDNTLKEVGFKLKDDLALKYVIVTLSHEGMALFDKEFLKIPTLSKDVFDVTGAGDTVLAAIAIALVEGKSIYEAVKFANAAAAVAVSKVGCVAVTIDEINSHKQDSIVKIVSLEKLTDTIKSTEKKVVFTNGCFDILHAGHVRFLKDAKSFGDILIVGLNSDDSVKKLKGENRPINGSKDRAEVLAALESVDFVIEFSEDTPYDLICAIKPNILVKGGDYRDKNIVGSDIVKEVKIVDFVDGKSTTAIIQKIK